MRVRRSSSNSQPIIDVDPKTSFSPLFDRNLISWFVIVEDCATEAHKGTSEAASHRGPDANVGVSGFFLAIWLARSKQQRSVHLHRQVQPRDANSMKQNADDARRRDARERSRKGEKAKILQWEVDSTG